MLQYGTCDADGHGCRGPAGVHTTDNPDAFGGPSDYVPMVERRGVPARIGANKRHATLATGKYVLIIGARDLETLEQAIAAVRPLDGELEDELPAPEFRVPRPSP